MSDFSNGSSAMPDGFSAASMDEMDQVDGGWIFAAGILVGSALTAAATVVTGEIMEGTGTLNPYPAGGASGSGR